VSIIWVSPPQPRAWVFALPVRITQSSKLDSLILLRSHSYPANGVERKYAVAPLHWRKGEVSGRLSILLTSPRFVNPLTKLTKLVVSTLGYAVGKAAKTPMQRGGTIVPPHEAYPNPRRQPSEMSGPVKGR
jgi:hypothetical protein